MSQVLPYDFKASQLLKSNLYPQLSNCGMIEFHIDGLKGLSGGQEVLVLGLQKVTPPKGRKMNADTIKYLNGGATFPTSISNPNAMSCTFQDYVNGRQREILHKWFDLVWNEKTGLSHLPKDIKANAHMVMWTPDGVTRGTYLIYGLWPDSPPELPAISYGQASFITLDVNFNLDDYEVENIGSYSPANFA